MVDKIKYSEDINNLNEQQQNIQDIIRQEAEALSVDPSLAHAVGWMENRFRPEGKSSAGAIGPMQIMPATAKAYGISLEDLKNPATNIKLGIQILKDNLDRYDGNVKAALVAYNGTPTRAKIYLRNNEDPSVLKNETQNYLKQAEVLYPNINEPHGQKSPFDYDMNATEDNKDTGVFGDTDELPEHIINFNPQQEEKPFLDKAIKYAVENPEVPSAGIADALLQSKINKAYNTPQLPIEEPLAKPVTPAQEPVAPTESAGDKWNRKVVGALGPGAESSTEAAKNYNLQENLNKQGQGQQWKVTREGIIRDPLALENERRIQVAQEAQDMEQERIRRVQEEIKRDSPSQRILRGAKSAMQVPAKVGGFGKSKFLGPLSSGASAANAVRAYERADELAMQGDVVGEAIARANAYASGAAAIPATPYIPLDVIKGVGTLGEIGLTGAEMLKDYLFPRESVIKKRPKEIKKADGGYIPISLKHVHFHRQKRNG
jgi:hypothetical protein